VYPVPDGDTGTNLTLTVRSIVESLDQATPTDRPGLARAVARAALMGARGNSGVIFSQIVRGTVDVLASTPTIDPAVVAAALRSASDAAYRAVRQPVEGTMLTVIRELAEEAEARAAQAESVADLLVDVVHRGEDAVRRTPAPRARAPRARPRRRSASSSRSRSRTCTGRRPSARSGSCRRSPTPSRTRATSSRSSPARGTGGSSRASAQLASSKAGRR